MTSPAASTHIGLLSPTRAHKLLTCPQRLAFEQSHSGGGQRQANSPASQLGVVVHRTLELALKEGGRLTEEAWSLACDEALTTGVDVRAMPEARRTLLRVQRRFPTLLELISQREATADDLRYECEFTSPDGRMSGQIDLLVLGRNPLVVDYKTGVALEGGEPLGSYGRQLAVYAWLVEKVLGVDIPVSMLFSLKDGVIHVDTSRRVREEVVEEITTAKDAFNERAPGPQPALPSENGCTFCPFVGECDEAWEALQVGNLSSLGPGIAIIGEVVGEVVAAANGLAAVPIMATSDPHHGSGIISDVPGLVTSQLQVGLKFRCWALGLRSEEPLSLVWRAGLTRLVKLR